MRHNEKKIASFPKTPELERLERGENKLTSNSSTIADGINFDYKYDDYDMRSFLQIYAQQAELETKVKTFALEPITAEQLSIALEGDATKQIPRTVIIACNLGGRHWVGIGIKITRQGIQIDYMDSMSHGAIPQGIINQLNQFYGNKITINRRQCLMQSDTVSCGPLTLKNLLAFASNSPIENKLFPSKQSVATIRAQQMDDITPYDETFNDKQLNDSSIVSSNEQYDDYMTQLNLKNYTNNELEQITNLVEYYNKIENQAIKLKILQAFSNTDTTEHRLYYNRIRNLFENLRKKKDLSKNDTEGINGILQLLFDKTLTEARQLSRKNFKELSVRILSYDALVNLFPQLINEAENLKVLFSIFKEDVKLAKQRFEEVSAKLKLTHEVYINIIRMIKSSDTWYEKINTETVLFIFSALTTATSAAMFEVESKGWQMAGKIISWLGVIATVSATIPQTKTAFFQDLESTLNNVKLELADLPEILEIFNKRFPVDELRRNLSWQRGIASGASLLTLAGLILNLTYDNYYARIFSMLGAGLASAISLTASIHNIGKIAAGAKKAETINDNILHAKIKKLEQELGQKDKMIQTMQRRIDSLQQGKETTSNPDTSSYTAKVEKYQATVKSGEAKFKEIRDRHRANSGETLSTEPSDTNQSQPRDNADTIKLTP